jgi:hypothetical protein
VPVQLTFNRSPQVSATQGQRKDAAPHSRPKFSDTNVSATNPRPWASRVGNGSQWVVNAKPTRRAERAELEAASECHGSGGAMRRKRVGDRAPLESPASMRARVSHRRPHSSIEAKLPFPFAAEFPRCRLLQTSTRQSRAAFGKVMAARVAGATAWLDAP